MLNLNLQTKTGIYVFSLVGWVYNVNVFPCWIQNLFYFFFFLQQKWRAHKTKHDDTIISKYWHPKILILHSLRAETTLCVVLYHTKLMIKNVLGVNCARCERYLFSSLGVINCVARRKKWRNIYHVFHNGIVLRSIFFTSFMMRHFANLEHTFLLEQPIGRRIARSWLSDWEYFWPPCWSNWSSYKLQNINHAIIHYN